MRYVYVFSEVGKPETFNALHYGSLKSAMRNIRTYYRDDSIDFPPAYGEKEDPFAWDVWQGGKKIGGIFKRILF
jgi:hypothetical protein